METYSQAQTNIEFSGYLYDSTNPYNRKVLSLENNDRLYVWFRNNTTGKEYEETATPKDSANLSNTTITLTRAASFEPGDWTWTVAAEFDDGTDYRSPDIQLFWVE